MVMAVQVHARTVRRRLALVGAAMSVLVTAAGCGAGTSSPPRGAGPSQTMPGTMSTSAMMPGAGAAAPKVAVAQGHAMLNGPALADALRAGGYVIVLRHGATDNSHPDAAIVNLADCGTQRPLNAAGIAQAKQIGQAVAALRLPVSEVLYSPYCRTRTTAQLEFGTTAQPDQDLVAADYHGVNRAAQEATVLKLINTVPRTGTDTALITHQNTLQNATGVPSPPEGGAEIYRPQPGDRPVLVAELSPADWTTLTHR